MKTLQKGLRSLAVVPVSAAGPRHGHHELFIEGIAEAISRGSDTGVGQFGTLKGNLIGIGEAIIGLTVTMGFPAFLKVMRREGMRKAEYDMVDACQSARRAAIMNNQKTFLVFHPAMGTFEVPGAFAQTQLPGERGFRSFEPF